MKKRFLLAAGGILIAATSALLAISTLKSIPTAAFAEWSPFDDGYHVFGTNYEVPTMSYNLNGVDYPATCITTYPDKTKTAETSYQLDQAGVYTLDYSVRVNGDIHSISENIEVNYAQAYVTNSQISSVKYYSATKAVSELNATRAGLYTKLAFGDELKFSKPIYVNDLLSPTKIVEGYIVPETVGTPNASQLFIKLTDADNPDIYVTYCYYSHIEILPDGTSNHFSSGLAKSNAQDYFAGIHQGQGLHTNDTYGLWSGVSFAGVYDRYSSTRYDAVRFILGLDYTEKKVYGTGFGRGDTLDYTLDLDDTDIVTNPWAGFKSDRVFMSIYAESYSSATMDFVINNIMGVSASELADNVFVDTKGPEINVLLPYDELPNGAVGYYYPIPEATAYDDVSLECDVNVEVIYNYFSDNSVNVEIKDNKFYLDRAGIYSILYTAKDAAGNVSSVAKTISVFTQLPKPDFELPAHVSDAYVGDYLKLSRDVTINEVVGSASTAIYYSVNGGQDVLLEEDGVRITQLSDYEIKYVVSDIFGQQTEKSYTVHVTKGDKPILENTIIFPRYFISRGYYDFPTEKAFDYVNNQLVEKEITLQIIDDNGANSYQKNVGQYSPVVNTNGKTVTVNVLCDGAILQTADIYTVKNLGTEQRETAINLPNYFVEENFNKTLLSGGIKFATTNASANVEFANMINANSFDAIFSSVNGIDNKGFVKVTLIDALNFDNTISIKVLNDEGLTVASCGEEEIRIANNDLNNDTNQYSVSYRNGIFTLGVNSFMVTHFDNGLPFNGFASQKAYVAFSVETSASEAEFTLNTLCSYSFSSASTRDRIAPVIDISDNYGGSGLINSIYTIEAAYSFDVLSPNVVFTIDVVGPDGEYITALDGTVLHNADPSKSYDIQLEQYGQYYFTLTSVEDPRFLESNNAQIISYYLRVADDVAPTIKFISGIPEKVTVGTVVYFPQFEVSDNITSQENLIIQKIILSPTGYYTYLSGDENGMKLTNEGIYRFIINVIDEAGNFATRTFLVEVTK